MQAFSARSLSLVLLVLGATPSQAQVWLGPAAVEVRAEDQGKPAADGEVRLEYLEVEPAEGPAPVKLDSRGRAVIGSLAEGLWRIEVSRSGAMTYRAEVLLRRDGKPEVVNAVQHNVPGAVTMMQVRFAKARGGAPPPQVARAPVLAGPTPAPSAPAPEPTPAPPAPEPAPPTPETEPSAPAPAPPSPEPAPAPEPAAPEMPTPAPPDEPAAPATPAPAPTPPEPVEVPPAPAPPAPEPERPAPEPAPETPQAPAPPPAPVPAPIPEPPKETPAPAPPAAPPAPPAPAPAPVPQPPAVAAPPAPVPPSAPRQGSQQDGSCAGCKPGESSLTVEAIVPPGAGSAGCGEGLRQALIRGGAALPVGCGLLRIELPPNARYLRHRFEVQDGGASVDCLTGKDCPGGTGASGASGATGRWPVDPMLFRDGTGKTTVSAAFENRSADGERRAVMTVYFKEARNPNAPRPMLPSRPHQPDNPPR